MSGERLDRHTHALLETVVAREPTDIHKFEPELVCERCDEVVCDVDPGDLVSVLVLTVLAHARDCGATT